MAYLYASEEGKGSEEKEMHVEEQMESVKTGRFPSVDQLEDHVSICKH